MAQQVERSWTDTKGRTIQGTLLDFNGIDAKLKVRGKVFTVPADTLSRADNAYLEAYAAGDTDGDETDLGESKTTAKKGKFTMNMTAKMFPESDGYFDTKCSKRLHKIYKKQGAKAEDFVNYKASEESMDVYVPKHYDGSKPFGVHIFVSSGDGAMLPGGYHQVLDSHDMIMASAKKSGNKQQIFRRIALALDALATIKKEYKIDDAKVYIGGYSGGSSIALRSQVMYPEIWKGCFGHAKGMTLNEAGVFGVYLEKDFKRAARKSGRIALLSGSKDKNYYHCKETVEQWDAMGFDAKFFDTNRGHEVAQAAIFQEALDWMMEKK